MPSLDVESFWLIVLDADGDAVFQGGALPFSKYHMENMVENSRLGHAFPGALIALMPQGLKVIYPPGLDIYVLLERFQDVVDPSEDKLLNAEDFMHHSQDLQNLLSGGAPLVKWRDERVLNVREEYWEGGMRGIIKSYNGSIPCPIGLQTEHLPTNAFVNPIVCSSAMLSRGTTTLIKYEGLEVWGHFFTLSFAESSWRVEFLGDGVERLEILIVGESFTDRSLHPNNLNSTVMIRDNKSCIWAITQGKGIYEFSFKEAHPKDHIRLSWQAKASIVQARAEGFTCKQRSIGREITLKNNNK